MMAVNFVGEVQFFMYSMVPLEFGDRLWNSRSVPRGRHLGSYVGELRTIACHERSRLHPSILAVSIKDTLDGTDGGVVACGFPKMCLSSVDS